MYTVGDLAKEMGISVRTVRFYDEKGILRPAGYSQAGYRIYDENSVEKLQKILMLRFLDFSLEQIEQMVGDEEVDVRQSLAEQERLLTEKLEHLERVLLAVRRAKSAEKPDLWKKLREIVELTREREFVDEQYRDDENFNKRVNIHEYSTAEVGFFSWMLEKLKLESGMKILEIGCGNAVFWKEVAPLLPERLEIHLTDYSSGMLAGAAETVEEIQEKFPQKKFRFVLEKRDAENFSYPVGDFDRIMANHVLFHLKKDSRPSLYLTIRDLLKEKGIFSCSLIGREHNRELHQLLKQFDSRLDIPSDFFDIYLETAEDELQEYFPAIQWWEQDNTLLVPDTEAIFQYVSSYSKENAERLAEEKERFCTMIDKQKNSDGFFFIHKATGCVVCKKG